MTARRESFKNNSATTLNEALDASETGIDVVDGSVFPSTGAFRLLVDTEIMLCTARATNTLTVVRGVEGTTGASHASAAPITLVTTQGALQRYSRDNFPLWDSSSRIPFRIVDASGSALVAADFTKVDGTTATTPADQDGTIAVSKTSLGSAVDFSLYLRTAPATPWTLTAALTGFADLTSSGSQPSFGIVARESSTGKFLFNGFRCSGSVAGARQKHVARLTDAVTLSANQIGPSTIFSHGDVCWCRIEDDGTDLVHFISGDGTNWREVSSAGRTAFLAGGANQIGWAVGNQTNTDGVLFASLLAWNDAA